MCALLAYGDGGWMRCSTIFALICNTTVLLLLFHSLKCVVVTHTHTQALEDTYMYVEVLVLFAREFVYPSATAG